MKRINLLFVTFFCMQILSAQSIKEVLLDSDYEVEFIGIDFSKCKLVGTSSDFSNPIKIVSDYFPKWNNFFYLEPSKFNMKKALRKKNVIYSIEVVEEVNAKVIASELTTTKTPSSFSHEDLQKIVSLYDFNSSKDISVVYVVNAMNKLRKQIIVNIVFFNSETQEILYQNELVGVPGGFGFRNYWLGGIRDILKITRSKEYKVWEKKYK